VWGDPVIRIGRQSIIEPLTFTRTLPGGASHSETYLRRVASGIQECEPPVTLSIDAAKGSGLELPTCLVVTPTEKRLRKFVQLHFAKAMGPNLHLGFYVLGGDAEPHQSTLRAQFGIGQVTAADEENVMAIVELVHGYAVVPAMEEVANLGAGGGDQPRGFLGA
jgi:hypothetical protein